MNLLHLFVHLRVYRLLGMEGNLVQRRRFLLRCCCFLLHSVLYIFVHRTSFAVICDVHVVGTGGRTSGTTGE